MLYLLATYLLILLLQFDEKDKGVCCCYLWHTSLGTLGMVGVGEVGQHTPIGFTQEWIFNKLFTYRNTKVCCYN